MHIIPEMLKRLRLQNGFTQKFIADYLSVTQQAYSRFEIGTREPDVNTLIKLAELFKVPLDILVGRYIEPGQSFTEMPKKTKKKQGVSL